MPHSPCGGVRTQKLIQSINGHSTQHRAVCLCFYYTRLWVGYIVTRAVRASRRCWLVCSLAADRADPGERINIGLDVSQKWSVFVRRVEAAVVRQWLMLGRLRRFCERIMGEDIARRFFGTTISSSSSRRRCSSQCGAVVTGELSVRDSEPTDGAQSASTYSITILTVRNRSHRMHHNINSNFVSTRGFHATISCVVSQISCCAFFQMFQNMGDETSKRFDNVPAPTSGETRGKTITPLPPKRLPTLYASAERRKTKQANPIWRN